MTPIECSNCGFDKFTTIGKTTDENSIQIDFECEKCGEPHSIDLDRV